MTNPSANTPHQPTTPLTPEGTPPTLEVGQPLYGGTFTTTNNQSPLPFVLPNERILPATAGTIFPTILTPSPDRTTPPCPHFGPCGGCSYQHATYPAQLALKRQILHDLLTAADLPQALPTIQIHAADPWHYRNRIRLRVEPGPTPATFLLGYNRRASNDLLPIHICPISTPILLRTAQALVTLAETDPSVARWLAVTAELELFTLPDESAVELQLFLHNTPATTTRAGRLTPIPTAQLDTLFTALCTALRARVPELSGATAQPLRPAHANTPTRPSKSVLKLAPISWGKPGLLYPIPATTKTSPSTETETSPSIKTPTTLWVSRNSFFQINRHLLPDLLATALHAATTTFPKTKTETKTPPAHPIPLAWDLFAGVGLFARALAPFATRITAVESAPTAVADLRAARLPQLDIVASTVLDFLRIAVTSRDRPSLVLLDPPRAGLGLEAAALLARLAPARIVYISCDPTTLARDLRPMLSSGYHLAELHLADMFPQTFHLETIAVLTLSNPTS